MSEQSVKPFGNYTVQQLKYRTTEYSRQFVMTDTNSGVQYGGHLYWNWDEGFRIYWDTTPPNEWHDEEDFEYELDATLGGLNE